MRYYIIKTQTLFLKSMWIFDWREKINPDWLCLSELYRIPKRIVLPVEIKEYIPYPDMITEPVLMVSELVYKVIKMYGEMVYTRDVILTDHKSCENKRYYLVVFENTENKQWPIQECNIFFRNLNGIRTLFASIDLVESILRRGAVGLHLDKIDLGWKEDCHNVG